MAPAPAGLIEATSNAGGGAVWANKLTAAAQTAANIETRITLPAPRNIDDAEARNVGYYLLPGAKWRGWQTFAVEQIAIRVIGVGVAHIDWRRHRRVRHHNRPALNTRVRRYKFAVRARDLEAFHRAAALCG